MFKSMPSIKLSKKVQGLIFYTCKNYEIQPKEIQERIKELVYEVCGKNDVNGYNQKALFEALTTEKGINYIAFNCFCSSRSICNWRKAFYESAEKYGIIPKQKFTPHA